MQIPLNPPSQNKPTHEEISRLAHVLYLQNGKREGHALEDWLQAEAQLTRQAEAATRTKADLIALDQDQVRPLPQREHQFARDARGSASREEVRQKTTPLRPAARQPQWRTTRGSRADQLARTASK
jgi:hypothetical protein